MSTRTRKNKEAAAQPAEEEVAAPKASSVRNKRKRGTTDAVPKVAKAQKPPKTQKYYAVRTGQTPGIYTEWTECQAQINGFAGANYKSFKTREEAELYVAGKNPNPGAAPTRFYAVAVGSEPGIYTEWSDAQNAYTGVKKPKYKKFETLAEAEKFMREYANEGPTFVLKEDDAEEDEDEDEKPVAKQAKTKTSAAKVAAELKKSGVMIDIYTDGSSLSNGKAGAMAGVGVWFGAGDKRNVSERLEDDPQTNQRAELMAIKRALDIVPVTQAVQIITDSKYSIDCVTNWAIKWEEKGWLKAGGGKVMNVDIIQPIRVQLKERENNGTKTAFKWVKGHSTTDGNQEADKLAVNGAKKQK